MERSLLDCIAFRGLINRSELDDLTEATRSQETDLEALLLDKYRVPKTELGSALGEYYRCPYVGYDERAAIDPTLLKQLSFGYLRRNSWIPFKRQGTLLDVVMGDPSDEETSSDIRLVFPGLTIRFCVGLRRDIEQYILETMGRMGEGSIATILGALADNEMSEREEEVASTTVVDENDSAIVRLASHVITEAYRLGASDVHIEPYLDRKQTTVRLRVDGTCFTYMRIPAAYRRAIVSRLKIMANLDIAERRKPQDGKIRFKLARECEIELRVATLPTSGNNEDVVLRILTAKETMPLEAMEFAPNILQALKEYSDRPHGILLCVGPTGSGKTTTLHAVLKRINTDERKIWTAEDPIEITQEGLRQVQVHPKIGLTFAAAMRAFLRADPDVIMIGEMRDKETADIAIEASLTGHLVLSTLHTNSAVETVTRLLDMGCDAFNFSDAMLGVLAVRLCKRICLFCREPYHPTREEYDELAQAYGTGVWEKLGVVYDDDWILFRGKGCAVCNHSGFKGRIAVHELLAGSEEIKALIQSRSRTSEILAVAVRDGLITLLQDGIQKVLRGLTTYSQVRSVAIK